MLPLALKLDSHLVPETAAKVGYRAEVDGLRALAVAVVILYHANVPGFTGGYLGVDVFFVISGYLITQLIDREQTMGRFSLISFYERRARRILPALAVVSLATIPFASIFLAYDSIIHYTDSLATISIFASNILFWQTLGYFDAGAESIPLLHTWSLAVEEQYYLLFPLVMLVFGKKRTLLVCVLGSMCLASFLAADYFSTRNANLTFFLLPFRFWELGLGSACALLLNRPPVISAALRHVLEVIGIVMIGLSVVLFSRYTPGPGTLTLAPTVGTIFVIVATNPETPLGRLLCTRIFNITGRMSYSLYLWHYPIFVFARLAGYDPGRPEVLVLLLAAIFVLSFATWRLVEQPLRQQPFRYRGVFASAMILLAFVFISIASLPRVNETFRFFTVLSNPVSREFLQAYAGVELANAVYRNECNFYFNKETAAGCFANPSGHRITLIWGDSYAQGLAVGLVRALPEGSVTTIVSSSCRPEYTTRPAASVEDYVPETRFDVACQKANAVASQYIRQQPLDAVIFFQRVGYREINWPHLISALKQEGVGNIVIVAPVPQWHEPLPYVHAELLAGSGAAKWKRFIRTAPFDDSTFLKGRRLAGPGVRVVYPIELLCDGFQCDYLVPDASDDDALLSFDQGHLSVSGSSYLVEELVKPALVR